MSQSNPEQKDIIEQLNEVALEANWGTVDRADGMPKAVAVIQEAVEEIKRLRRAEDDLRLYETQMKNGEIDMTVGSENCSAFIWSIIQIFFQNGAKNFFTTTVEVDDKRGERYALTIQKVGGETPAEQLSRIRKETAEILKEVGKIEFDYYPLSAYASFQNILKKYGVTLDEKNS